MNSPLFSIILPILRRKALKALWSGTRVSDFIRYCTRPLHFFSLQSVKQAISPLALTALISLAPLAYAQAVTLTIVAKDGDVASGTIGQFILGFNSSSPDLKIDHNGTVYFHASSSATDPFGSRITGIWTASNGAPTPLAIVGQVLSGFSQSPLSSVSSLFLATPGGRSITYVDN